MIEVVGEPVEHDLEALAFEAGGHPADLGPDGRGRCRRGGDEDSLDATGGPGRIPQRRAPLGQRGRTCFGSLAGGSLGR